MKLVHFLSLNKINLNYLKHSFVLVFALLSFVLQAQIVSIPDANFKAALIADGVDTNSDGEIQVTEAEAMSEIDVGFEGISDLTGIEAFINITELHCSYNNLTNLDLSSNILLETVFCSNNNLTTLNITNNLSLMAITCSNNNFTSFDLSDLSSLLHFLCQNANLEELNIQNGNNTAFDPVNGFNVTGNPGLTCIQVDDAAYSTANWLKIDPWTSFSIACFPVALTYVPDDNFEQALIDSGYDDVLDDHVATANINTVTTLSIDGLSIADLTGIEDFEALEILDCSDNYLSLLNMSSNTNLEQLECSNNALTSLNISNNANLGYLYCDRNNLSSIDIVNTNLINLLCYSNNLTALDTSINPNLINLLCADNAISTLNFTNNLSLEYLSCDLNLITNLDLSMCSSLNKLSCGYNNLEELNVQNGNNTFITNLDFNTVDNPDLTCIQVDDVAFSTANWTHIDPWTSFSNSCDPVALTYVPDDNFEQALIDSGYDDVLDDYVATANINTITALNVMNEGINDMTGIEDFSALTSLNVAENNLTSLDVSALTNLGDLECPYNNLATINVSGNTNLFYLNFSLNSLNTVDLSNCIALEELYCEYNNLDTLIIDNNTNLTTLDCSNNNLTELHPDNSPLLENLKCNDNNINTLTTINNTSLVQLNVSNNSLTHVFPQNMPDLEELQCNNNSLSHLVLVHNPQLTLMFCSDNELVVLDMKNGNNNSISNSHFNTIGNPDLICIQVDDATWSTTNWTNIDATSSFNEDCSPGQTYVPDNNFEQALIDLGFDSVLDDYVTTNNINFILNINLSNKSIEDLTGIEDFTALKTLNVNENLLDYINIDNNTNLEALQCNGNDLTGIKLDNNLELNLLKCAGNQIGKLDMSNNSNLAFLNCSDNLLTKLDVRNGNNTAITDFFTNDNLNLTCIYVDDATYSTANWINIDASSTFVEDELACLSLQTEEYLSDVSNYIVYPNPVYDVLQIKTQNNNQIKKIAVFNSIGKNILIVENTNTISFKNIPIGLYFIKIFDNKGNIIIKKIVNK